MLVVIVVIIVVVVVTVIEVIALIIVMVGRMFLFAVMSVIMVEVAVIGFSSSSSYCYTIDTSHMLRVWLTTAPTTRDDNINNSKNMTEQEQGD